MFSFLNSLSVGVIVVMAIFLLATVAFLGLVVYFWIKSARLTKRFDRRDGFLDVKFEDLVFMEKTYDRRNLPRVAMPYYLKTMVRNYNSYEISRRLLEFMSARTTDIDRELLRVMTISATIYKFKLPCSLAILDSRTFQLARAYEEEMKPHYVSTADRDPQETGIYRAFDSDIMTALNLNLYSTSLPLVAQMLMYHLSQGPMPTLPNFVANYRANAKKRTLPSMEVSDIQAMVSACAMMSNLAIPKGYVVYNALTRAIIAEATKPTSPKRHLSVVKNSQQKTGT